MLHFACLFTALIALDPAAFEPWQAQINRFERDIQDFEALDEAESSPEDAILFVGSSSIRLWKTIVEDMAPYPVIQRGYGGARFSDLAYFADRIISPHECRAIVIFVANDVTGSAIDKPPAETAKFFRHVLHVIRSKQPDVPVFLIEITPTAARWKVWDETQATNAALKEVLADDENAHFIATAAQYLNDDDEPRPELFIKDRLHLNHDGYKLWASLIKAELAKVLEPATVETP